MFNSVQYYNEKGITTDFLRDNCYATPCALLPTTSQTITVSYLLQATLFTGVTYNRRPALTKVLY